MIEISIFFIYEIYLIFLTLKFELYFSKNMQNNEFFNFFLRIKRNFFHAPKKYFPYKLIN